ncbi:integrase [Pantoea ananatis]|nr:integrase [Pantoea ananatis]PKC37398.1 transposase [Pantoea ananatis 15320]KTR47291.1 integrase [Pantoea ananatis]KTR56412.1 integrase [Pantoea ananatis]KTR62940.1 integrase [Pantoea ananatis]
MISVELKEAVDTYIQYYNHERIKEKLKGLSPAGYRAQFMSITG